MAVDRRTGDWNGVGSWRLRCAGLERGLASSRVRNSADSLGVKAGAANFAALDVDQQAIFKARLIREMRTNTYDAAQNRVMIDADRAAAFQQLAAYYADVFANGPRGIRDS